MKLQDRETLDIAKTVGDVIEGKKDVKEIKYPHKMYSPDGEEVTAKTKEEHDEYSAKGYTHSKPVKEVEEPRAKGEKDFKAKHAIKKSGMKNDGSNIKEEVTITIDEAKKPGRGKTKLDIDWIGSSSDTKKAEKKHKVKIKQTGRTTADISGEKKNILALLMDPDIYGMDSGDAEDLFPELFEAVKAEKVQSKEAEKEDSHDEEEDEELSPKQKKYQAFFQKALKKFGVKSPEDLDKEKRKEFFDYIDANWEGENESD